MQKSKQVVEDHVPLKVELAIQVLGLAAGGHAVSMELIEAANKTVLGYLNPPPVAETEK